VTALQTPLLWLNVSLLIVIALDVAATAILLAANSITARR
jgi:hypothetical protein